MIAPLVEHSPAALSIEGLSVQFAGRTGTVTAVENLSYSVAPGETVAVVGESGSGKSTQALAAMRLLPPAGKVTAGAVRFGGQNILEVPTNELRRIRGAGIGMVFQDPMTSLNPVLTIGRQLTETLEAHVPGTRAEHRRAAVELLGRVRLPDPHAQLSRYPHQLSGGMRQRVVLAQAVACRPRLLFADEPTTALDVTVQAQILDLIAQLSSEEGMAVVLITHDLGLVARYADRVVVMYAGRTVETAPTDGIFHRPAHPYTRGLLRSRPTPRTTRQRRLAAIPGSPPDGRVSIAGCAYAPRCDEAIDRCHAEAPPSSDLSSSHRAACWHLVDMPGVDAARGSDQ